VLILVQIVTRKALLFNRKSRIKDRSFM